MTQSATVSTAQEIVGLVFVAAGLVLGCVGVVKHWRTLRSLGGWPSPTVVLSRAQRKELLAQVRGLRPVDPARVPLARDLAGRLLAQCWFILVPAGLVLTNVGQWIDTPTPLRGAYTVGLAIVLGVACVFAQRDARRAWRFLDAHPPLADPIRSHPSHRPPREIRDDAP